MRVEFEELEEMGVKAVSCEMLWLFRKEPQDFVSAHATLLLPGNSLLGRSIAVRSSASSSGCFVKWRCGWVISCGEMDLVPNSKDLG